MQQQHPSVFFDEAQASSYDERFARLAPLRETLDLLVKTILSNQPTQARILSVGAGTGADIISLAERFPGWHFTAVEPSGPMLEVCRRRMAEQGLSSRCDFHQGFLDSLPASDPFDAATSILVSHFILAPQARVGYFQAIASRVRHGGCLVNADLAFDTSSPAYPGLLEVWMRMMKGAEVPPEQIENMRKAYDRDVAILPPSQVAAIISESGFEDPVPFFQAGLIHGWYARRGGDGAREKA